MSKEWQPIETAPKDGRTIEVAHDEEGKETSFAFWSQRPVCMLGDRNGGFPPGWATAPEQNTDVNLPLSEVVMWRDRE